MKLAVIFVGGQKEAWLDELAAQYEKKLNQFTKLEIVRIKPSKLARDSAAHKCQVESEAILRALRDEDYVILCDERGESLASRNFSKKLTRAFEATRGRVCVVVGGPFGVTAELSARAQMKWSLSPLVLSHVIAQAVVLEQLYRAFAIARNLPYHND